jgi:hypothetical protein
MAKNIKAIRCPHCGSVDKTAITPGFYRCSNCGTEYYLDSDDVHIYHHQERPAPTPRPKPSANTPRLFYLLAIALVIAAAWFAVTRFHSTSTYRAASAYKMPRMYYNSFVYTNTATGEPVYLRLGTDNIAQGNEATKLELHAQFNNALNGKLVADRLIDDETISSKRCALTFKTYLPDLVYAIGCNSMLLQLDTRNNQLTDVTNSVFRTFPELAAGVARLDFDYYRDMITVMNNEGESYFYFPVTRQLVHTEAEANPIWQKQQSRRFFVFGALGDAGGQQTTSQLIEVRPSEQPGETQRRDISPGRKYFAPRILYQDDTHLLIVVNTTAAPDPPVSIQRIDVQTGQLLWALPPDRYNLYSCTRWKKGFAVEYRKGPEADYVHGVLVLSDEGKLLNNYQLSRIE